MVRRILLTSLLPVFFWSESLLSVQSFSLQRNNNPVSLDHVSPPKTALSLTRSDQDTGGAKCNNIGCMLTSAVLLAVLSAGSPAYADEYGVEKEAPTLFTGETVEICTKRGPLGACLATEMRTVENDNDKSEKYFKGVEVVKRKDELMRSEKDEGNLLIEKLMKQSDENREKNDLIVKQKTALNDQSANFGPFDSSVVILNEDGKGFTLLKNPQAMRLKNAGFIKDKKFVKQPTQQELDDALESDQPGFLKGLFGGNDD